MYRQTVLTRTALMLAITLIFQSLRLFIPIPPLFSTFLIGSLVNATLLISLGAAGYLPAMFLSIITPIVAYFQQMLLLPVFIAPVAAANIIYVSLYALIKPKSEIFAAGAAASAKAVMLYMAFVWLLGWLNIPAKAAANLMFIMSWPQLVTALIGAAIAREVTRRLDKL